ncbi:DUF5333 domain-containing protein [Parasulfitobacter algicola]|uniref:DUF5333 domain-containing protein n=1 Tax=Parasulfitobacter algicola TaxID=2614809 RepID=A0ABX2J0E8_9RHOB|nr:DUF5333 domain-containing protein [Sulfitobacter algicola]NSX56601.1 DUF5333 domain-containing protein [Sulfitobacter algicola]
MRHMFSLICALVIGVGFAAQADAREPLNKNKRINNELLAAAIGDEIRKNCSTISARMWVVYNKGRALENYAQSLGFTDDEIDDFMDSKVEQERMKGLRNRYLAQNGVTKGDEASYCRLGEKEIADRTLIGSLLRR